jgi:hypothetical protein
MFLPMLVHDADGTRFGMADGGAGGFAFWRGLLSCRVLVSAIAMRRWRCDGGLRWLAACAVTQMAVCAKRPASKLHCGDETPKTTTRTDNGFPPATA